MYSNVEDTQIVRLMNKIYIQYSLSLLRGRTLRTLWRIVRIVTGLDELCEVGRAAPTQAAHPNDGGVVAFCRLLFPPTPPLPFPNDALLMAACLLPESKAARIGFPRGWCTGSARFSHLAMRAVADWHVGRLGVPDEPCRIDHGGRRRRRDTASYSVSDNTGLENGVGIEVWIGRDWPRVEEGDGAGRNKGF